MSVCERRCLNPLTPNDLYMSRTAPLTSKRCILYIYSTNVGTEYFKHALYSPFFPLQNAVCFIMLTSLAPVLFTFYKQGVLKLKKKKSGAKGLTKKEANSRPQNGVLCICSILSVFFSLQNAVCFIMLTSLVPVLFTFYIQVCAEIKKK